MPDGSQVAVFAMDRARACNESVTCARDAQSPHYHRVTPHSLIESYRQSQLKYIYMGVWSESKSCYKIYLKWLTV